MAYLITDEAKANPRGHQLPLIDQATGKVKRHPDGVPIMLSEWVGIGGEYVIVDSSCLTCGGTTDESAKAKSVGKFREALPHEYKAIAEDYYKESNGIPGVLICVPDEAKTSK